MDEVMWTRARARLRNKMPGGARNWMGTLNGIHADFDAEGYFRTMVEKGLARFVAGQIEQGAERGTIHLQYYIQRHKQTTLATIRREICDQSHWEIARGTAAQCIAYVTKNETRVAGPWQFGKSMTMGNRTDLAMAAQAIRDGKNIKEIAIDHPEVFIKYHKGILAYQALMMSKGPRVCPPDGPEVWVFWGPTGTGKSRRAFEAWPHAYRKMTNDKWWDGYKDEDTVIFDDFKGSSMRLHDFQLIVDRYPVKVETKGSTVELAAWRLVFTANKHPSEWYSQEADPEGTVWRRIDEFCARRGRLIHCVGDNPSYW